MADDKISGLIDGNKLAENVLADLARQIADHGLLPKLHIFTSRENEVSKIYVDKKRASGESIGVSVIIHEFDHQIESAQLVNQVETISAHHPRDGVMVQLPLPAQLSARSVLESIPAVQDVDVLNRTTKPHYMQPVTGAVKIALENCGYGREVLAGLPENQIHVVGKGFLVGQPIIGWLRDMGIKPVVYQEGDDLSSLRQAQIIISGTGSSHLITPDLIRENVVLIDAGTATDAGELRGDIHPDCYRQAAFYTPVPGGIGPLTLVSLLQNVVKLASK